MVRAAITEAILHAKLVRCSQSARGRQQRNAWLLVEFSSLSKKNPVRHAMLTISVEPAAEVRNTIMVQWSLPEVRLLQGGPDRGLSIVTERLNVLLEVEKRHIRVLQDRSRIESADKELPLILRKLDSAHSH